MFSTISSINCDEDDFYNNGGDHYDPVQSLLFFNLMEDVIFILIK